MAPINIAAAACVMLMVVFAPMAAFAATFPVDWNLSTDYSSWTTKDISVGDQLVFNYGPTHDVYVVSESDYSNCGTSSASFTDASGKTTYPLTKEGAVYFICSIPGHCPPMHLQVNVKAARSPSSPTPTSSATTPTSTPTPPADTALPPPPPPTTTSNNNGAPTTFGLISFVFGASLFAFFC